MKNKRKIKEKINREDTTKYGEFVASFFSWIGLDKQKKKAKELENMTKEK